MSASQGSLPNPGTVVTIEPSKTHTHSVILLHGRGSTAEEFGEEFFESTCADGRTLPRRFPNIKWILPSAQERYSTVFQEPITEWFDIYSLTDPETHQELQFQGMRESTCWIFEIIQQEIKLIPSKSIFLGGISQGCATAIIAFVFGGFSLAGFIGMSGFMAYRTQIEQLAKASSSQMAGIDLISRFSSKQIDRDEAQKSSSAEMHEMTIPIRGSAVLLSHGLDDTTVDISLGRAMRDTLLSLGLDVQWKEDEDCGHWIKEPDTVDDIAKFIADRSGDRTSPATLKQMATEDG